MFLQNLRAKVGARLSGDGEAGFTLIELLVVMLILGILAAIALPAFFNQKSKAGDAKAKEYAHSAQVAIETCNTEKGGTYVGCDEGALETIEPTLKSAPNLTVTDTGGASTPSSTGYRVTVEGSSATQQFSIDNDAGEVTFPCTEKGVGGCPEVEGEGNWGS